MISDKIRDVRKKAARRRVERKAKKLKKLRAKKQRAERVKQKTAPVREEAAASKRELRLLAEETGAASAARRVKRAAEQVSEATQNVDVGVDRMPADTSERVGDRMPADTSERVGDRCGRRHTPRRTDVGLFGGNPFGHAQQENVDDFLGLNQQAPASDPDHARDDNPADEEERSGGGTGGFFGGDPFGETQQNHVDDFLGLNQPSGDTSSKKGKKDAKKSGFGGMSDEEFEKEFWG